MGDAPANSNLHIEHVPLELLHDHPDNDVYSQDAEELDELTDSIEREGLGQLPLVRPFGDGYQIIAGHRRIECFRRLNEKHPGEYATVPVSVRDDLDDRTALLLLDTTNLITRRLSIAERAKRYERIWKIVPEMRKYDHDLRGVRTSQVIADIVTRETGESVSRASIDRAIAAGRKAKEVSSLAEELEDLLSHFWYITIKDTEGFAPDTVKWIASLPKAEQKKLQAEYQRENMTPRQFEKSLRSQAAKTDADAERVLDSMIRLARDLSAMRQRDGVAIDLYRLGHLQGLLAKLQPEEMQAP